MSGSAADFIKPYNLSLNRAANLGSGVGDMRLQVG